MIKLNACFSALIKEIYSLVCDKKLEKKLSQHLLVQVFVPF